MQLKSRPNPNRILGLPVIPCIQVTIALQLIVCLAFGQEELPEFSKSLQDKIDSINLVLELDSNYVPQIDISEPIPRGIPKADWEKLLAEKISLAQYFDLSGENQKRSLIVNSIMPEDLNYSSRVDIWWHKTFSLVLMNEADIPGAMMELEKARDLALISRNTRQLASIERMMAFNYHYMGNDLYAREHFQKVVDDYRDASGSDFIISTYMLIELDCNFGDLESARKNLKLFDIIRSNQDPEYFNRFSLLGHATYYLASEKCDSALIYFKKLLDIYMEGHRVGWPPWLMSQISLSHLCSGNFEKAIEIGNQGLEWSIRYNLFKEELDNREALYKVYISTDQPEDALIQLQKIVELKEQIGDAKKSISIANTIMQNEYNRQARTDSLLRLEEERVRELEYKTELNREKNRRNLFLLSSALVIVLSVGLWSRLRYIRRTKNAIEKEKERSDRLLLNILPEKVAEELKVKGETQARHFEKTSVLFTDFKGFTAISEQLSPSDLVDEINVCFRAFDTIVEQNGIEKIKTIGDSYMAAGGLHIPRKSEARDVVMAAIEMQEFMDNRKVLRENQGELAFEMRVGIHSGPVVAGVVGVKKFQYDIWGDTVNTASRIESCGEAGKVNISKATYELVKNDKSFEFYSRGLVKARGKGEIQMYFVSRSKQA